MSIICLIHLFIQKVDPLQSILSKNGVINNTEGESQKDKMKHISGTQNSPGGGKASKRNGLVSAAMSFILP